MIADRVSQALINLTFVRELRLASAVDGAAYFHAASGLALCAGFLHVISDDSSALASFELSGDASGKVTPLLMRGGQSSDRVQRKLTKPDFEALVHLPPEDGLPHGGLLAMGSGSTAARTAGVIVALDPQGRAGSATEVDLEAPLYARLREAFSEVNIEGGVWRDGRLLLFQRGNVSDPTSAVVTFEAPRLVAALQRGHPISMSHCHRLELGFIDGVPLTFTDATLLDDRILYLATAERTPNAYDDGEVLGSILGILSGDLDIGRQWRLDPALKFEGVAAIRRGRDIDLFLVSDADDPAMPSGLFAGSAYME